MSGRLVFDASGRWIGREFPASPSVEATSDERSTGALGWSDSSRLSPRRRSFSNGAECLPSIFETSNEADGSSGSQPPSPTPPPRLSSAITLKERAYPVDVEHSPPSPCPSDGGGGTFHHEDSLPQRRSSSRAQNSVQLSWRQMAMIIWHEVRAI